MPKIRPLALGIGTFEDCRGRREGDRAGGHRRALGYLDQRGRKRWNLQSYKGLGEMNAEQLWETTLDPNARVMLQVRLDDAVQTDPIFTILRGDQVSPVATSSRCSVRSGQRPEHTVRPRWGNIRLGLGYWKVTLRT